MSSRGQPTRGGIPAWVLEEVLISFHCKNWRCFEKRSAYPGRLQGLSGKNGKELRHIDIDFGLGNLKGLYCLVSPKAGESTG